MKTLDMAADRRVTFGNTISSVKKLFCIDNDIVGIAGTVTDQQNFLFWYESLSKDPASYPEMHDGSTAIVYSDADKCLYKYEKSPHPIKIEAAFFAIGSGRDFAIAAMHCGKSAYEAAQIACLYDAYCGGWIDQIVIKKGGE